MNFNRLFKSLFGMKDDKVTYDEKFAKLFTESKKIKIVLVIGQARQGKSTLCNYLTNPKIGPIQGGEYFDDDDKDSETFETAAGDDPLTSGIQGSKISIQEFKRIHELTTETPETPAEEEDYDIIFLDTEGFGTIADTKESGKRGDYFVFLLSFLGISSIILDLSKDNFLSTDRIENIKRNLVLLDLVNGKSYQKMMKLK